MAERKANAIWEGNLTEGKGTILSVGSGAIGNLPITWAARTESSDGKTSPEELIAAAHAACFAMASSNELDKAGYPPERVNVTAICTADRVDGKFTILSVDLQAAAKVPNINRAEFDRVMEIAKGGCPVSRSLGGDVEIRLTAHLED